MVRYFNILAALAIFPALAVPRPVAASIQSSAGDRLDQVAVFAGESALGHGVTLAAEARWDEARRAFEVAIRWNPDLAPAHYNLGVTLGVLGRSDDAIVAYREALRLQPRLAGALVNLGVELFKVNRPAEGLASLEQAVRVAPQDAATRRALADAHYNIGVRHTLKRRWIEAIASYERAIAFHRDLPEAFNATGVALAGLRRDTAALVMFDEALRQRPSYAEAHYHRARSLEILGHHSEAMAACRAALSARPRFPPAVDLLQSLERRHTPASRSGAS